MQPAFFVSIIIFCGGFVLLKPCANFGALSNLSAWARFCSPFIFIFLAAPAFLLFRIFAAGAFRVGRAGGAHRGRILYSVFYCVQFFYFFCSASGGVSMCPKGAHFNAPHPQNKKNFFGHVSSITCCFYNKMIRLTHGRNKYFEVKF